MWIYYLVTMFVEFLPLTLLDGRWMALLVEWLVVVVEDRHLVLIDVMDIRVDVDLHIVLDTSRSVITCVAAVAVALVQTVFLIRVRPALIQNPAGG